MSNYSVKRPITVLMGVLIIIVLGAYSLSKLPLTLFPDIELPFVVTVTTYPGENPETLESEVTNQIEASVATIGNFDEVSSMSYENFAVSVITFADGTNMDSVVVELRENLNNIIFNENVGNTRILRISPDMLPVMTVTLFKTYDESLTDEEILIRNTEWINTEIINDLNSIEGVADVSISGQADVVLQVRLDDAKLTTYGLTQDQVLSIIEEQNTGGLVGVALDNGEIRMLYLGNIPQTLDQVKDLAITHDGTDVIRLSDLAVADGISYVDASEDSYSKINGEQGIQISFQKQSDVGITEVTSNILEKLDQIVSEDSDAEYLIILDQGEYINTSISSVVQNIIIGGILAVLILFIFLKDIKPTLIIGLAIPISVIAAFMLMYFSNVTLNLVSMGGLALAIGMLVDNAVVVIENIYRMINEGKSKKEAAIEGAKQVAGAITASTLTTIAVFLPIVFVEGLISDVFMSMALTIAFSLGASLVIALTVVPSMSALILNDKKENKEGKIIHKLKDWYESSVLFTLKYKAITIITVLVLLAGSFLLVYSKGFILLPESDEGSIEISIETQSLTSFSGKANLADALTVDLLAFDDVESVAATIGASSNPMAMMGMFGSSSGINFSINLKDNRKLSTTENEELILNVLETYDYDMIDELTDADILDFNVSSQNSAGALTGGSGISIKVSGYDLSTLEDIANDLTSILETVDHVVEIDNGVSAGSDNVKLTVNQDKAIEFGLTNQDVNDNLNYLFANLSSLTTTETFTLQIEGVDYELDIPNEALGDFSFTLFGDYLTFLSGVRLFDQATRDLIDTYELTSGMSIYVPNVMLPTYVAGTPIQFIVNPYLVIDNGVIEMNPVDFFNPTLESTALAPLFNVADESQSITQIEKVTGFSTIYTDGSNRYITVTAQIEEGYNVTLVSSDATNQVNAYLDNEFNDYGSGYRVEFAGENEEIMKAVSDLAIAALVAILLVYMIMAIQFQSLIYPVIILATIPLAFTGGLIALLITNMNLSMVSIMGLIILVGVVVNNGIVLIDYINKLREKGLSVKDAIVEAGKTRLRPILMTALTTILALLVMAIGVGEGSELLQPMAITAIGGLIYATLLTLVVVPTIYAMLNRKAMLKEEDQVANQG
ncbi:MAG: efflux RND transporter permease subunit [Acholeplasmataceae bacterium]|nr:efflux RND transporter permease subunit [Acholeplasmataceae bacterium]